MKKLLIAAVLTAACGIGGVTFASANDVQTLDQPITMNSSIHKDYNHNANKVHKEYNHDNKADKEYNHDDEVEKDHNHDNKVDKEHNHDKNKLHKDKKGKKEHKDKKGHMKYSNYMLRQGQNN